MLYEPTKINSSFVQGGDECSVVCFIPGHQNGVQVCVDLVGGSGTGAA